VVLWLPQGGRKNCPYNAIFSHLPRFWARAPGPPTSVLAMDTAPCGITDQNAPSD
jgi:hypothetical protein